MEYPTPKILELSFRLTLLMADLERDLKRLQQRLGTLPDDQIFVLNPDPRNIKDLLKEKQRLRKQWKVVLKEILESDIDYVDYLWFDE